MLNWMISSVFPSVIVTYYSKLDGIIGFSFGYSQRLCCKLLIMMLGSMMFMSLSRTGRPYVILAKINDQIYIV